MEGANENAPKIGSKNYCT